MADEVTVKPVGLIGNKWRVIAADIASSEKILSNLQCTDHSIVSVTVASKSASDATPTVYIVAKKNTSTEFFGVAVEVTRGGYYTSICECGAKSKHGAHPPAELGPCDECFRDVSWSYEPFSPEAAQSLLRAD